jgi:hypothetical protein
VPGGEPRADRSADGGNRPCLGSLAEGQNHCRRPPRPRCQGRARNLSQVSGHLPTPRDVPPARLRGRPLPHPRTSGNSH